MVGLVLDRIFYFQEAEFSDQVSSDLFDGELLVFCHEDPCTVAECSLRCGEGVIDLIDLVGCHVVSPMKRDASMFIVEVFCGDVRSFGYELISKCYHVV